VIPYTFSVLRYVHDAVTTEFVNVGVALYSGDFPYLKAKCTTQYGRITRMFDRIDGDRFKQTIRHIEEATTKLGVRVRQQAFQFAELGTSLEALLKNVLPTDDSAIQFSPVGLGVSADLEGTLSDLFERYVERYAGQPESPSRSDDEVWRVFRDPLERRKLLQKLAPKRISAPNYEFDFRAAWKNEVWHVYEPVSFDLVEPNSLLDKANRWVGRSASLADSGEGFKLHLLVGVPQDQRLTSTFTKARNILSKMAGNPDLGMESEAESFAADLERELDRHEGKTRDLFEQK
jgi:hypothetical protein